MGLTVKRQVSLLGYHNHKTMLGATARMCSIQLKEDSFSVSSKSPDEDSDKI